MASILDTPTSVAAATHTFAVSAGANRALVVLVQTEGTQSGDITCTYGGESMVNVAQEIGGSGTTQQTVAMFFLNNAGIVAASGTTLSAGNLGSTDNTISAASYEDCVQTTPTNYDTDTSDAATPNPLAALDITTTAANSVVVAGSGMGNAGSAAWASPLTERTDQAAGSSNGSLADDEVASGSTLVACECTWTTQNRACAVALELVHAVSEGITSIDPTTFDMDNADIDINGTNFLTPQGTGDVYLSDANTLAGSANEVDITSAVNTWSDTVINLDLTQLSGSELDDLHTLGPGQRYLIVVNSDSDEYGSTAITLHRPEGFVMSLGAGTPGATTARLLAPATKTTGDFDAGRFEEAANPAATVNITTDNYTEMVWSMEAKPLAREVAYQFRVTIGGVVIDDYTVTPQMTIGPSGEVRAVAGIMGASGALKRVVMYPRSQAGDFDGDGALARKATQGRFIGGDFDGSGEVTRKGTLSRFQDGAHSFAGEVYRIFTAPRSITGAFCMAGTVTREILGGLITEAMAGALSFAGNVYRKHIHKRKTTGQL